MKKIGGPKGQVGGGQQGEVRLNGNSSGARVRIRVHACVYVRGCVCVCVRACVRVCVRAY